MAEVIISVEYTDGEGGKKSIPYYYDDTQVPSLAAAVTLAGLLEGALNNTSDAVVTGLSVKFEIEPVGSGTPAVYSRVDYGATAQFLLFNGKRYSYYLPAIKPTLIANQALLFGGSTANAIDGLETVMLANLTRSPQGISLVNLVGGKQTVRH